MQMSIFQVAEDLKIMELSEKNIETNAEGLQDYG